MFKRYDLAIINRSFWPSSKLVGEALLQLGEKAILDGNKVVIIAHDKGELEKSLEKFKRGKYILFRTCKAISNSSTKLFYRIIESLIFMIWVIWNLLLTRPRIIYISTDPPLTIPFVVFLYSKISKASYVYHLQDIHPELLNIKYKLHSMLFNFLKKIDELIIRNASSIITITNTMKNQIISRSNTKSHIYIINNPTVNYVKNKQRKIQGFVFSGNLGRLQRIPLLIKSIIKYKKRGGKLPFIIIGSGLYSSNMELISKRYKDIMYLGYTNPNETNEMISNYEWALLPIEDEATKYSFPSKTSSYLSCKLKILSICSSQTSVAKWVTKNKFGINVNPNLDDLVDTFFQIENGLQIEINKNLKNDYTIKYYIDSLYNILLNKKINVTNSAIV